MGDEQRGDLWASATALSVNAITITVLFLRCNATLDLPPDLITTYSVFTRSGPGS